MAIHFFAICSGRRLRYEKDCGDENKRTEIDGGLVTNRQDHPELGAVENRANLIDLILEKC